MEKKLNTKMEKKFYDLHCHAFNLSHPNLMAVVQRFKFPTFLVLGVYYILGPFLPIILVNFLEKKKIVKRMQNLLSVMENDIGSLFLLMEECIKSGENPLYQNGQLQIGGNTYQKMVLTPLMMDFGYKNMLNHDLHYQKPPQKPIVEQVVDVFNGIKSYQEVTQGDGFFEIYPFLGINTKNYSQHQVETMLDKYFRDYKGSVEDLQANQGQFTGDIEKMSSNFFAGIKMYPPLGFNPWPEEIEERKKVECLYEYCSAKQIPITAHCSDGGFVVVSKQELNKCQDPQRWVEVLEHYPELRLNLAHFGNPEKWAGIVAKLLLTYPNVYADLSYSGYRDGYYKTVKKIIGQIADSKDRERLKDHLLFGSDFMMHLFKIDSYSGYLRVFSDTEHLSGEDKDRFASKNAEEFLFGGHVGLEVEPVSGEEMTEEEMLVMV